MFSFTAVYQTVLEVACLLLIDCNALSSTFTGVYTAYTVQAADVVSDVTTSERSSQS